MLRAQLEQTTLLAPVYSGMSLHRTSGPISIQEYYGHVILGNNQSESALLLGERAKNRSFQVLCMIAGQDTTEQTEQRVMSMICCQGATDHTEQRVNC